MFPNKLQTFPHKLRFQVPAGQQISMPISSKPFHHPTIFTQFKPTHSLFYLTPITRMTSKFLSCEAKETSAPAGHSHKVHSSASPLAMTFLAALPSAPPAYLRTPSSLMSSSLPHLPSQNRFKESKIHAFPHRTSPFR